MQLTWHGLGCVRLQTKETTILVDPFAATLGITAPRAQADILLFSQTSNPQLETAKKGQGFVISGPGEYEVHGVSIVGLGLEQETGKEKELHTIYVISAEGLTVGFLGELRRPMTEQELDEIQDIDVLFVPVGGKTVVHAEQALEMVSEIEPRVVIPYYYKTSGLKLALDGVEAFTKQVGKKDITAEEKYKITKKDLPEGDMQVVVLKP